MHTTRRQLAMACSVILWAGSTARADEAIPFPKALDSATVAVDRLDSVLDYALLIGMYDSEGERLDVFSAEGEPVGDSLGIDTISVVE